MGGEGQKHLAGVGRVEALDQLDRRRLAAPRRADERDLLPRQRREGEAVEDLLLRLPREGEVNEGDGRGLQHQAGRQRGRSTCGSDGKVKSTSTKSMRPATRGGASLGGAFGIGSMRLFPAWRRDHVRRAHVQNGARKAAADLSVEGAMLLQSHSVRRTGLWDCAQGLRECGTVRRTARS